MNETVMTIEDAASRLPEVVERVYNKGEPAIIVKGGRPIVRIVPITGTSDASDDLASFLRRWRTEHPDPDDGFGEAIEESRRAIQSPRNPWE